MFDYGVIYLIDTQYNAERDATEVTFGYIEKEEAVKGRIMTLRAIVNMPGRKGGSTWPADEGIMKAREFILRATEGERARSL